MRMPDASHRNWPPPDRPWILAQSWADVLFLHWPMPIDVLAPRLPGGVALDTHEGEAWISVVPFRMVDVHLRGLPVMPGMGDFPELNVRTYVTVGERKGVWFFSLDAASRIAVGSARRWFHLPYFLAEMRVERDDEPRRGARDERMQSGAHPLRADTGARGVSIHYTSRRIDRRGRPAAFDARFTPTGPARAAERGSLDHFLAERYCLFAARPDGTILRGDVHHAPWPLQPVEVAIAQCDMLGALGLPQPSEAPRAAYAARVDVPTWAPKVAWRGMSRPIR